MSKGIKIFFVLTLVVVSLNAQQLTSLSLVDRNQTIFNPGATGNQGVLSGEFLSRQNWTGFDAFSTQSFCAHTTLKNPAIAVGILVDHNVVATTNYTGIHFNYAYRIKLGENRLSFGLKLGLVSTSQKNLEMRDEIEGGLIDPTNANLSYHLPNAGFGIHYSAQNFWFGLSVPRIIGYEAKDSEDYKLDFGIERYRIFFSGGGRFDLSSDFSLEPSALFILSPVSTYDYKYTINALGVVRNKFKAGLGYRSQEALIFIVGYNFNQQFSLAYAYDLNMGEISDYSNGSHEIQLQYKFGYKVNASNPRGF